MMRHPPSEGEITLAVDRDTSNPILDLEDVTRVAVDENKVVRIGKGLEPFNGVDTGIFFCTPAILEALDRSISQNGDSSLSGGVGELAVSGKVNVFAIQGRFWIDVDDPDSMDRAEQALLEQLKEKLKSGAVAPYI